VPVLVVPPPCRRAGRAVPPACSCLAVGPRHDPWAVEPARKHGVSACRRADLPKSPADPPRESRRRGGRQGEQEAGRETAAPPAREGTAPGALPTPPPWRGFSSAPAVATPRPELGRALTASPPAPFQERKGEEGEMRRG